MTQERWNVDRYRVPYLDIQSIRRLDDALELSSRQGVFRLNCSDASAMEEVLLPMLNALRDPASTLWNTAREPSEDGEQLRPLLRELDHLGLIRDSASTGLRQRHEEIEEAVRAWSAELGRDIAERGEGAARVVEQLAKRLAEMPGSAGGVLLEETSFPVLTLLLQARYLRADAPSVLALLVEGLNAAQRRARMGDKAAWWAGVGPMPSWAGEDWSCGLVDPGSVRRYLTVVGRLVRDALGPDAPRRVRPAKREPVEAVSGINFLLDLEGELAQMLAELGASPVFTAMEDNALARLVVKAAFLQEYFVTCRFVECIAPLLARRLTPTLREAVHRYFTEELGHEKYERENCLKLGWTEQQIDTLEPLPLYVAFVDVLTNAARESPVSFFCATMFTEGIIGSRHSLVSLAQQAMPGDPMLIAAIGEHVAINDDVDHRGVGRDWMSHLPNVAPQTQREVREWAAFLAELNWRMWHDLVRSCAA
jgi:hypothetical protein